MPFEGDGALRRRGGFRGRRGGGPPGGAPGGGPPPARREFDRHSATGRGREAKKQGAGGHNWGQEETENVQVKTETALADDAPAKEESTPQEPDAAEVKENEGLELYFRV